MKIIKKLVYVTIIVLCSIGIYYNFFLIQNAFDEMYYTRVRYTYCWFGGNRPTLFGYMKQLKGIPRDNEQTYTRHGFFREEYEDKYLDENESLSISVDRQYREIYFRYVIDFQDNGDEDSKESVILEYTYKVDKRTLLKNNVQFNLRKNGKLEEHSFIDDDVEEFLKRRNLTWEELDKKHEWFLYDKFLTDWFDANRWVTRFSKNYLGSVDYDTEIEKDFRNGTIDKTG